MLTPAGIRDMSAKLAALNKSHAIIEFYPDGTIITANDRFLALVGYGLGDIQGRHHGMFVPVEERDGAAYRSFWDSLRQGHDQCAEFRRVARNGSEIWIQANYDPILDPAGRPTRIVKFATDITAQVMERLRRSEIQAEIDSGLGAITGAISTANRQAASAADASVEVLSNVQAAAVGTEQIAGIQGAIGAISAVIGQINAIAGAMSAAVDEQNALTAAVA